MNNKIITFISATFGSKVRSMLLLFVLSVAFISCKNQKGITLNNRKCILDFKNAKTLTANLKKNEFKFTWLKARLSIDETIDSSSNSFTVSLRMKKDSIIWMSISKLGIEGARVLITKDSVKFVTTFMESKYFKGDFAYISKLLNTDLDFDMLQSLLIGNSVAFYDDDEKIKAGVDNCQYTLGTIRKFKLRRVMEKGKELKDPVQSIYMIPETFKIDRIIFYEFNPDRNFDARFSNYEKVDSTQLFPLKMKYVIKAEKSADIEILYKNVVLNEELSFPFKIPANYEPIEYKKSK